MNSDDAETAALAAYIIKNAAKFRQPIMQEQIEHCITWLENYQPPHEANEVCTICKGKRTILIHATNEYVDCLACLNTRQQPPEPSDD